MSTPHATLHYIFDPLCGWCYAAAPLVQAARQLPGLDVAFHGGGMMTGRNRRPITPEWREYVLPHDRRIAQLTGLPFGDAYFDGLLRDTTAMMDSAPPTTAILAAEAAGGRGLDMLHRLQTAHYVDGLRIADHAVLQRLAAEIGLDAAAFDTTYARLQGAATEAHISDSRRLLAQVGGHGFPTLVLEQDGALTVLDIGPWLGKPAEWQAHLAGLAPPAGSAGTAAFCTPNGCTP